ncbi:hypothetical protein D9756_007159 [Leucocoprinus leucothites]|uniref:Uncharacterized protein n=1 Tax=Leucocoprinus leucothites TaxID=201217 RepID=A0A8H5D723_9AGAR|nr:hypothetical protein D9756_007159 [Leucoagaricus leucothites]
MNVFDPLASWKSTRSPRRRAQRHVLSPELRLTANATHVDAGPRPPKLTRLS